MIFNFNHTTSEIEHEETNLPFSNLTNTSVTDISLNNVSLHREDNIRKNNSEKENDDFKAILIQWVITLYFLCSFCPV